MDKRAQLAVDTLLAAIGRKSQKEQQLNNGLLTRHGFQQQLAKGDLPVHPRFEWMRRHARFILELLLQMPKDFISDPPDSDRISMADLLDVSSMATSHIADIIKLGFMDPDKVNLLPFEEVKGSFVPKTECPTPPTEIPPEAQVEESEEEEEGEESPDLELLAAISNKK